MSGIPKTVPVTLPEGIWGRCASEATERGVSLPAFIAGAIIRELELHPDPRHTHQIDPERAEHNMAILKHELREARRSGWRASKGDDPTLTPSSTRPFPREVVR